MKILAMLTMINQVQIDCPPENVFAFISKAENFPKWNYYLVSVIKTSEGNPFIGATYHQTRKKDQQDFAITAYEENRTIEFSSVGKGLIRYKRKFNFTSTEEGCMIDDLFQIRTFLPGFINRMIAKRPQAAVKENLLKLKQLLETGETILQDGRKVGLQKIW